MRHATKTHKGAAKRFRIGARGRIKVSHGSANHLKSTKNAKRIRRIRRTGTLDDALARKTVRTLPRAK